MTTEHTSSALAERTSELRAVPPVFIHGVGVRWSAMDLTGCRCFSLSVSHSLSTCLRIHVFFPARATALPRIPEFDVGLIYHVRLTPARSSVDGLCLACRSSDAVQKVFFFPFGVPFDVVVPAASAAESNVGGSDKGAEV